MPDPSLRMVILGAGPIGLETALYARYLGYQVELLERGGAVASDVLEWGHVQLFTPFAMNATPLGVAAIDAHHTGWQRPGGDELLTGAAYHQRYLSPLAETDLVAGTVHLGTEALAVGRAGWLKPEGAGDPRRGAAPFHILAREATGQEQVHQADVVIDCTGTYRQHNWLGSGGIPAPGELAAAEQIEYALPDLGGPLRERYLGRSTLLVGTGYSAATTATQLAHLARDDSRGHTQITWITRHPGDNPPITRIADDPLDSRDRLARDANRLATESGGPIVHLAGTSVAALRYREASDDFEVVLQGQRSGTHVFDRVIANVGYRPDARLYAELHVHECYASSGPMQLASQLAAGRSEGAPVDCLEHASGGPSSLSNPEPNFYILGGKSYGRGPQFLLSRGFDQIRDLFTLIAQREDLDLYATMPSLMP